MSVEAVQERSIRDVETTVACRFVGTEGAVPDHWGPHTNLQWKVKLPGSGASSPIILGAHVYVTCYSGYGTEAGNAGDKKQLVFEGLVTKGQAEPEPVGAGANSEATSSESKSS